MPKKKGTRSDHCHFPQRCNGSRKFSPVKSFSKVKTVKSFSMFHQKKKKYSNGRSKNRFSQFHQRSQNNDFPSVSCSFNDNSWFWSNYQLAQQWQRAHMMSVQKANLAVSMFQKSLFQPFKQPLLKSNIFNKSSNQFSSHETLDCDVGVNLMGSLSSLATDVTDQDEAEVCGTEDEYEFEFNVDENMRNFLEQSMRHKQEMQRLKEAEEEANMDADMFEAPKESAMEERKKAMDFLYGVAAPKILSMEMALQMSFDRHFDQKQPAFWPNLPLLL